MASYYGYDGDESEQALVSALRDGFVSDQTDALEKVRTTYMRTGHVIEIAVARGYTKRLGLKGWLAANVAAASGPTKSRNDDNK